MAGASASFLSKPPAMLEAILEKSRHSPLTEPQMWRGDKCHVSQQSDKPANHMSSAADLASLVCEYVRKREREEVLVSVERDYTSFILSLQIR